MATGIRVIRGPDWSEGDEDGGEGHVGTVVHYGSNGSAQVLWDNGKEMAAKIGQGGKHELRILDNGPVGVRHKDVICDGCSEYHVAGIRWKCGQCDDFDLCSICYATDKHDLTHHFLRIDTEGAASARVSQRNKSMKVRAMGIFPGASVVRGKDWNKGNQDGGAGQEGTVTALVTPGSRSARSAVTVRWGSGQEHNYRVGQDGKVDLKFTEEGQGIEYYPQHLPSLDMSNASANLPNDPCLADSGLKEGDKVCIELDENALKELHRAAGSWSAGMSKLIGQVGQVKGFSQDGSVSVEFGSQKWRLLPGALRKVPTFSVGDIVRILSDADKVRTLQEDHGGWLDEMKPMLGKTGRVVKIDSDGDVAVSFGSRTWLFNPACCVPAAGSSMDDIPDPVATDASAEHLLNLPGDLANLLMGLVLMKQSMGQTAGAAGIAVLFKAILEGDTGDVRRLLEQNPSLVRADHKGVLAMHMAAHEGKLDMVKLLLEKGADGNATDNEGDTPLHVAIIKQHPQVAEFLIKAGVNVNKVNQKRRQPIHNAAYIGMTSIVRLLVAKSCDLNSQDSDGDTPIFDAIGKDQSEAVEVILTSPTLNLKVTNKRGFTPLHMAAFKGSARLVEKILRKNRSLVNLKKEDGYTPLHLAAFNDHSDVARTLIDFGKADMDAKNNKGEAPIHLSCRECYMATTKVLVEKGTSVNIKDGEGDTPLHTVLMGNQEGALLRMLIGQPPRNDDEGRVRLGCYLIQHSANIAITNNSGQTPLDVCRSDKLKQAIQAFSRTSAPATTRTQSTPRTQSTQSTQSTPRGASVYNDGPKLCSGCLNVRANAVYLPCGHKETCRKCCTSIRTCGACGQDVTSRVTEEGRKIGVDCVIQ